MCIRDRGIGGSLKRKESISARLGDILSALYLASTALKYYEDIGDKESELPLLHWTQKTLINEAQEKIHQTLSNFPNKLVSILLRLIIFPLGRNFAGPSIEDTLKIGRLISRKTKTRENLIQGIYLQDEETNIYAQMNKALELYEQCKQASSEINKAKKKGLITGNNFNELVQSAKKESIITKEDAEELIQYNLLADQIINVDDFSQEEVDQIR